MQERCCTILYVLELSSLLSLVRCRRWDPLANLLSCGGLRNILLRSVNHIEFVVCPDEFMSSSWLCCWKVVSHVVKPAVPFRKLPASIDIPECVFAFHFCGIDDLLVTAKKLPVVLIVSIFVFSHQATKPYIICPKESL